MPPTLSATPSDDTAAPLQLGAEMTISHAAARRETLVDAVLAERGHALQIVAASAPVRDAVVMFTHEWHGCAMLRNAVGSDAVAVAIDGVREILDVGSLTALRRTPAVVRGLMTLRGGAAAQEIVRRMMGQLKPHGVLHTGHAESLSTLGLPVRVVATAVHAHA